jgi:ABC-type phosphate/phosphonate transport system substrate-binding protein
MAALSKNPNSQQPTAIAGLSMYDLPELHALSDEWWSGLARAFRAEGIAVVPDRLDRALPLDALWSSPDLFLTQICGYQLRGAWAPRLRYVATPRYAAPGCEGVSYCSWVVVKMACPASEVEGLRGARCVINSQSSHSGCNALRALVAPLSHDGRFFGAVNVSGSHAASLAQLQDDLADVAAIDCVTYALLERWRPQAVARTRILARTQAVPSLPYATRLAIPSDLIPRLRAGLFRAISDPALVDVRNALLLAGFEVLSLASYDCTLEMASAAARRGYLELDS